MKQLRKKLTWSLFRKPLLQYRLEGFSAQNQAYASRNCSFSIYNKLTNGATIRNSTMGKCSYISGARVENADIGSFCSIGHQALIGGLGRHPTRYLSTHPVFYSALGQIGITFSRENKFLELPRTTIGNDVWIGARAIVLDGLSIGDGCIIAAGSVVTKDVAPFSIVGGIPAKLIRMRFSEDVVELLLAWKWWDLPLDTLRQIGPEFSKRESWEKRDVEQLVRLTDELHAVSPPGQPANHADGQR